MWNVISAVRGVAELVYFGAGICVAIVAIYGLKQLSLLKADMLARSDRAAKEKAIEGSEAYLCSFVPLFNAYYFARSKIGIPTYGGAIGDFSPESLPKDAIELCKKRYAVIQWLPAMNRLESIAAGFVTGVADDRTGFEIIGRTYCAAVQSIYDILSLSRREKSNPYFNNIVRLYLTWAPRLSKAELATAKDDLESRITKIRDLEIPPLGPKYGA